MHDPIPFTKMEALGNDFVILDARQAPLALSPKIIRKIAHRHCGIGCDQILVLEQSETQNAKVTIFNADGSTAEMCGNGMRALGLYLNQGVPLTLETAAGPIQILVDSTDEIHVSMGPLRKVTPIALSHKTGYHVNMGNPHTVFFQNNITDLNLSEIGPCIETDPLFPHRTNVEFAEIIKPYQLKLRIWERGTGETLACGSGACAVVLAYWHHFGVDSAPTEVMMPGGSLLISSQNGEIYQRGPARFVFEGSLTPEFLNDE